MILGHLRKTNPLSLLLPPMFKLHVVQLHSILFPLLSNVFVGMDPLITVKMIRQTIRQISSDSLCTEAPLLPRYLTYGTMGRKLHLFQKGPLSPANLFLAGYTSTTTKYSEQQPRNFKIQRIGINPIDM